MKVSFICGKLADHSSSVVRILLLGVVKVADVPAGPVCGTDRRRRDAPAGGGAGRLRRPPRPVPRLGPPEGLPGVAVADAPAGRLRGQVRRDCGGGSRRCGRAGDSEEAARARGHVGSAPRRVDAGVRAVGPGGRAPGLKFAGALAPGGTRRRRLSVVERIGFRVIVLTGSKQQCLYFQQSRC